MTRESDTKPAVSRTGMRRALVAYVAAWAVAAAIFTIALLAVLDSGGSDEVTLPPIRETELAEAARDAGCELRRSPGDEPLNPPVDGPPDAAAARPGFYDEPVPPASLVAALRDGVVVIQFRADFEGVPLEVLRRLQAAVPAGTIVAPNSTEMPFEVAVTAYRRLLGCHRFSDVSIDAMRLFQGRFVGSGPDP